MAWEKIYNIILNAIKAKTDNLPVDPSSQSLIDAKLGEINSSGVNTIFGHLNGIYYHLHSPAKSYPFLADGITIQSSNSGTPWTLGNFVEIIPANTIQERFDIHTLNVEACTKAGIYQIVLYSGLPGNEVQIGTARFHRDVNNGSSLDITVQIPIQEPGARISAKLAKQDGTLQSITVSVYYHTYTI